MSQNLTAGDILAWKRDGFLVKRTFADASDFATPSSLRRSASRGQRPGRQDARRCHPPGDDPVRGTPGAQRHPLLERGRAIVRQLTGQQGEVPRTFDMLIYKPAGHPHETPWHQDMSYAGMPFAPAGTPALDGLQFWVPFEDVDEQNSCMQFVPGHHQKPLLPHVVASGEADDPRRLLAIDAPEAHLDLYTKVVAELPAGGVTVHGYGTPHYTGPNHTSDRPRRAYTFNLATPEAAAALFARKP